MANLKLTTVKVIQKLYDEDFKIAAIRGGINFQKLVNRSLDLYTKDERGNTKPTIPSGISIAIPKP